MNRREAIKTGLKAGALAATLTGTIAMTGTMTGCTSATIEGEVNVILQGLSNVLAAAGQTAWSEALAKAEQALATAEATWKAGGAVQILIDALNAVEAVTAVIPVVDAYSPLIDVIVTAIESVLALLPASTKAMAARKANLHAGSYRNFTSARQGAKQWNVVVEANPKLHVAKLHVPMF